MANRFNQILPNQQYVSSHIPLPLDLIAKQGAQKQQELDSYKKALNTDTDPLSKIGDLSFSLKTYDKQGNIVDQTNNELERYKNQTIQQLASEREKLASDLAMGKISDSEFKQKAALHTKNATNAYNQLAGYKSNATAIQKANEEYAKSKSFGSSPYYGTDMLDYNTQYMENARKGIFNPYNQQSIAEDFDMQKALREFTFKDAGREDVSLGEYITKTGDTGVTAKRVKYAADRIFNDPTSKMHQYAKLALMHDMRLNPEAYKSQEDINKAWEAKKQSFITGAVAEHAGIIHTEDAKGNPVFAANKAEQEDQKRFEMGLQYVGADPSTAQNDSNFTRIAQGVLGDNFETRDGELHYNPVKEGTKYVNVFGKNINADKALVDGNIDINGTKFTVSRAENGAMFIHLPEGPKKYPIKTANKYEGMDNDMVKLKQASRRLGYIGEDTKEATQTISNYMQQVYNLETTSTQFPVGLEGWLSSEFRTNVDKEGNITNPGQLSNMELKSPNGELIKPTSDLDLTAMKAQLLKGARISGFSKTLTNDNIKAGDLEITGSDGQRYILSTGKVNLANATSKSDRALKSVNNFVMNGKRSIDEKEADMFESGISNQLGLPNKDAINITSKEVDSKGNEYVTYVISNKGNPVLGTIVFSKDPLTGKKVITDKIDLSETARRLDSDGVYKHLRFYAPKATAEDATLKNYQTEEE